MTKGLNYTNNCITNKLKSQMKTLYQLGSHDIVLKSIIVYVQTDVKSRAQNKFGH